MNKESTFEYLQLQLQSFVDEKENFEELEKLKEETLFLFVKAGLKEKSLKKEGGIEYLTSLANFSMLYNLSMLIEKKKEKLEKLS